MRDIDYWLLCDELSINQAAHLVIGLSPTDGEAVARRDVELTPQDSLRYKSELGAVTTAICGGLRKGAIRGRQVPEYGPRNAGNERSGIEGPIDVDASIVEVESLRQWLASRGICEGFFFLQHTEGAPDYLDRRHPRYAPKLAAAVRAWLAVEDPKGKHPKQALMKWLREHSAEFDLSDEEGKPNEQGIEECAKVANWQPGGGAPKTPSTIT